MENYELRRAFLNDLPAIMVIIDDAGRRMKSHESGQWQDRTPRQETFINDIENNYLYVAASNNLIVGVMAVLDYEKGYEKLLTGQWSNNDPYLVLHRFAVKNDYLRKGVASFMLKEAENLTKTRHIWQIRIDTHEKNLEMISLLVKNQYIKKGSTLIEDTKLRIVFEKIIN